MREPGSEGIDEDWEGGDGEDEGEGSEDEADESALAVAALSSLRLRERIEVPAPVQLLGRFFGRPTDLLALLSAKNNAACIRQWPRQTPCVVGWCCAHGQRCGVTTHRRAT